jgi:hypothetical protein
VGPNACTHFNQLTADKAAVEGELGQGLDWYAPPGYKQCRIFLRRENADPAVRERWPEQQEWLRENLEAFHRVFAHRVKNLVADVPSDGEVNE